MIIDKTKYPALKAVQTQVFEESEIRKVYLQELMRTLKISERKAKKIYGIVKKQVEEQKGTG